MMVKIKVTQQHIDKGIPCHPSKCAIAIALADVLVSQMSVAVGCGCVTTFRHGRRFDYDLPEDANNFAEMFDCRQPVKPFAFELDLPGFALAEVKP